VILSERHKTVIDLAAAFITGASLQSAVNSRRRKGKQEAKENWRTLHRITLPFAVWKDHAPV